MVKRSAIRSLTAAIVALLAAGSVHGQGVAPATGGAATWPARPLRMLIPFAAAGAVDTTGRLLGQKLAEALGRTVIIENRPGAAGMIAIDALLKAPADGHVVLVGAAGVLATTPAGQDNPIYDPLKDIEPVSLIATFPFVLVVIRFCPRAI